MPSIVSILPTITRDYPALHFAHGDFRWSASDQTVFYDPTATHAEWLLLHELGHAVLGHVAYTSDIELIHIERAAWQQAKNILAPHYGLAIDEDFVEDHLDTYREWLHKRSLCPICGETGIQTQKHSYRCVIDNCVWRVNEARSCALRRYTA